MNDKAATPSLEVRGTPTSPLGMPPARFLRDYWQQRPLLIRGAFADFSSPLQPEDLAGLACEELALSRIAILDPKRDRWTLRSGPFAESDFAKLPKTHWTLLVQDVDKWDADVAALREHFAFLPSWRVDDIMVSYAVDGGSVGAHVDQYDVFLLQGQGRRRWQISTDPRAPMAFREDAELKLLREFTPTHEWLLEPGDMLYLPPGIAHHGVAEGSCLTLSIGTRAPALAEMLVDLAEFLAERMPEQLRYGDAAMAPAARAGEIDAAALARVRTALAPLRELSPALLRDWFGGFMTRYRTAHDAVPREPALGAAQLERQLTAGADLMRNPWSRLAWSKAPKGAVLFVSGERHACRVALAQRLCADATLRAAEALELDANDRALLLDLVNAGHLALTRPPRKKKSR